MQKKTIAILAGVLLLMGAGIAQDYGLIATGPSPDRTTRPEPTPASPPATHLPPGDALTASDRDAARAPVRVLGYPEFLAQVRQGHLGQIRLSAHVVQGTGPDGRQSYRAHVPPGAPAYAELTDAGARVSAGPRQTERGGNGWMFWLGLLLLVGALIWYRRRRRPGSAPAKTGKSTAKLLTEDSRKARFTDVAGCDEAKADLEEVVDFLKNPDRYTRVGGQIPRGVLLSGPPGTGKTLLARAVAGEAGVPFFSAAGSGFTEMYVGVGASRVRDMFAEAKKKAPCIVFIDEIDSVGRRRNANLAGSNEEREQTLNQLLAEMDGFDTNEGIILIGATNMPEALDPALTRPGRFDRQVTVPNPDVRGREQILAVHARKVPLAYDVHLDRIARATPGFSGADLANIVNEAALFAARAGSKRVWAQHFELAGDKVRMGAERRGLVISEQDRRLIAYHEAGHAIVGLYVPGNDPLHKVTIVPRGHAMGFAMWLPEGDRWGHSIRQLTGRIAMAYGGRVAEELVFGREYVTSGAQGDIRQASAMARRMVLEWGMSEAVGLIDYALDPNTGRTPDISAEKRALIDGEIDRLLTEGEATARRALQENWDPFQKLAHALLDYETIDGDEIDQVIAGQSLHPPEADDHAPVRDRDQEHDREHDREQPAPHVPALSPCPAG